MALIPIRLLALADAAGPGWAEAYLAALADDDPQLELAPAAAGVFLDEVAGLPAPARWDAHGVLECLDADVLLRALFWFEPATPASARADVRRYGFSTAGTLANPRFRREDRDELRGMRGRWDKFTRPVPRTLDEWVYL